MKKLKSNAALILFIAFVVFNYQCTTSKKTKMTKLQTSVNKPIDITDLDLSVSPKEDFYQYATGGWQKKNPLPDDESRFGTFDQLAKETNQKIKDIITCLDPAKYDRNSIEWKIATFYKLGMDTEKIEADGLSPITEILTRIDDISTKRDLIKITYELHSIGIPALFGFYGAADRKDSNNQIAYLSQGGLGLPNRDYYVNDDERSKQIRDGYVDYIQKIFSISGYEAFAETWSSIIMKFETSLAEKSMTNLELRDPFATTNRLSLQEIQGLCPDFNLIKYFDYTKLNNQQFVNVGQPEFFKRLNEVYNEFTIEEWKIYFKWKVLNYSAPYLGKEFTDANFEIYGRVLTGTQEQQERWRRVVNRVNSSLGEAVGQIFVRQYFPPEAKKRMEELVENLRIAFGERIKNLDWMSDVTKQHALEKLQAIRVKIGYPEVWKDYSNLIIKDDNYLSNIFRSNKFDYEFMISKIGKPVDKTQWFMNPQTVNAYYSASMNEICFPAGILQPPFFYMDADDAVNYGAIGVVIGHEMTHGFDDKGRNYDKDGNLNNWWTDEDAENFNLRAQVLVDRYNAIHVLPDLTADGKLSLGENIADYGGLKIAYDALQIALKEKTTEKIDGFTPEQRFYLAYAKIWGQNIRETEIRRRTKEDVHSLGRWRVNGQLPGIKEFQDAFDIKEGDKMYLPPEKWINIW
ncbi:MAG: M13 family metallopeptidase [Bacteroidales bacterium]|jgi:putative endopeptidase